MAENFPQIVKEAKPQIQDAQQMTGRISKKKSPKHIVKHMITYKGTVIDFSTQAVKVKKTWGNSFSTLEERILYLF